VLDIHEAIQPFTGPFDLPGVVAERVERTRELLEWNLADLKPKEPPRPNWTARDVLKSDERGAGAVRGGGQGELPRSLTSLRRGVMYLHRRATCPSEGVFAHSTS